MQGGLTAAVIIACRFFKAIFLKIRKFLLRISEALRYHILLIWLCYNFAPTYRMIFL
jgi:hypothetical protein